MGEYITIIGPYKKYFLYYRIKGYKMNEKRYFIVFYANSYSFGCTGVDTIDGKLFNRATIIKKIEERNNCKRIMITGWNEVTKKEHQEFLQ